MANNTGLGGGLVTFQAFDRAFSEKMLMRRKMIRDQAADPTTGAPADMAPASATVNAKGQTTTRYTAAPDARAAAMKRLKDAGYGTADNPLTEDAVQAEMGQRPAPAMDPNTRRQMRGQAFQQNMPLALAAARNGDVESLSRLIGLTVTRAPAAPEAAPGDTAPASEPGAKMVFTAPGAAPPDPGYLVGGRQVTQEYLEQLLIPQALARHVAEQVHELDVNRQAGVAPRLPTPTPRTPKFTHVGNGRFFDPVSGKYAEAPPITEEALANEKRLAQSKRANSMTITEGGDGKKWRIVTTPEGVTTTSPIEEIPAKSNLTVHVGPETKTVRIDGIDKQVTNTVSRTFNKNTGEQIGDPEILAEGSAKPGEVLDHVGTGIINGKKMYFVAHSQDGRMTDKVWSDTMPAKYAKLLKDSPATERAITITQKRADGKLYDLKGTILVQRLADGRVRYAFPTGDFGDEARKQYGGLSAPPDEAGGPGPDLQGNASPVQAPPAPAPQPIAPHPSESDVTRHVPLPELEAWRNDLAAKAQAGDKKAAEQMSQVDLAIAARKGANASAPAPAAEAGSSAAAPAPVPPAAPVPVIVPQNPAVGGTSAPAAASAAPAPVDFSKVPDAELVARWRQETNPEAKKAIFAEAARRAPAGPTASTATPTPTPSPGAAATTDLMEPGNINLKNRPRVKNANGSISTVRSKSFNIDGQEVLLPTVSEDGRIMSDQETVQQYKATGKHLGKFATPEAATEYAVGLHRDQAKMLDGTPSTEKPDVMPTVSQAVVIARWLQAEAERADAADPLPGQISRVEQLATLKIEHAQGESYVSDLLDTGRTVEAAAAQRKTEGDAGQAQRDAEYAASRPSATFTPAVSAISGTLGSKMGTGILDILGTREKMLADWPREFMKLIS